MKLLERIKRWVVRDDFVIEVTPQFGGVGVNEVINHPLFRAALLRITNAVAQVPLVVYDNDKLVENHHLVNEFADNFPTPQAVQTIVADLYIFGNSFWAFKRVGNRIVGLTYIPFTSVMFNADGTFSVYLTNGSSQTLTKDDLLWFKLINPTNPEGLGLSIAQSLTLHFRTLIEIDRVSADFLANGALPFAVFKIANPSEKEVYERERERLKAMFGRGNRFGWLVASKGVDINTIDTSLKLGELPEVRKTLREEILAMLGVPPAILGFYEYANYANAREQTKIFWRELIFPLLAYIAETINTQYLSRVKKTLWCQFDFTVVPYAKERLDEIADSLVRLVSSGIITINEAREILGMGEPLDWGDKWWGSLNTVPVAEKGEEL